MLRLRKFLCCNLEYGGLVVGAWTVIVNFIRVTYSVFQILHVRENGCSSIVNVQDAWCPYVTRLSLTVYSFNILYGIGVAFIGCLCLQGTISRNHFRIKPMRIFLIIYLAACFAIAVLTSLFVISSFVIEAMIFYFLCISIYLVKLAYSLLIIDSLYKDFKQKYEDDKADKRMTVNYYGGPVASFKVEKEKQIL